MSSYIDRGGTGWKTGRVEDWKIGASVPPVGGCQSLRPDLQLSASFEALAKEDHNWGASFPARTLDSPPLSRVTSKPATPGHFKLGRSKKRF